MYDPLPSSGGRSLAPTARADLGERTVPRRECRQAGRFHREPGNVSFGSWRGETACSMTWTFEVVPRTVAFVGGLAPYIGCRRPPTIVAASAVRSGRSAVGHERAHRAPRTPARRHPRSPQRQIVERTKRKSRRDVSGPLATAWGQERTSGSEPRSVLPSITAVGAVGDRTTIADADSVSSSPRARSARARRAHRDSFDAAAVDRELPSRVICRTAASRRARRRRSWSRPDGDRPRRRSHSHRRQCRWQRQLRRHTRIPLIGGRSIRPTATHASTASLLTNDAMSRRNSSHSALRATGRP